MKKRNKKFVINHLLILALLILPLSLVFHITETESILAISAVSFLAIHLFLLGITTYLINKFLKKGKEDKEVK